MWISLSIEEEYDHKKKRKLIQEKFMKFNKPEFNNWRKHNRRISGRDALRKTIRRKTTDHMEYIPDYTDLENRDRKADYEFY